MEERKYQPRELEVGACYKSNWKWDEEPEFGYFQVLEELPHVEGGVWGDGPGYRVWEINPWGGGPWYREHVKHSATVVHAIKVNKLEGITRIWNKRGDPDWKQNIKEANNG